ncbi:hypothetical protein HYU95_01635 [Candidatus Daviesbacteria bacterium]|nr:hypothetical protein [Candidatus Daviesbacteria bacterium]
MDPKNQLSGLDPKLKEAYERVMGTIPPASPKPSGGEPASPPPQQPPTQEPTPPPAAIPQSPEPAALPQQPESPPPPPAAETSAVSNEPSPSPIQPPVQPAEPPAQPDIKQPIHIATGFVANAPKKEKVGGGLKISRPIFMALGVTFLVLYVFFWIRVFNLSLF